MGWTASLIAAEEIRFLAPARPEQSRSNPLFVVLICKDVRPRFQTDLTRVGRRASSASETGIESQAVPAQITVDAWLSQTNAWLSSQSVIRLSANHGGRQDALRGQVRHWSQRMEEASQKIVRFARIDTTIATLQSPSPAVANPDYRLSIIRSGTASFRLVPTSAAGQGWGSNSRVTCILVREFAAMYLHFFTAMIAD
jgi:hypothetical protein